MLTAATVSPPSAVAALNDKSFRSKEPRVNEMLAESKNFSATTNIDEVIAHSNDLWILVDTPSTGGERCYDHSKLSRVLALLNSKKV